MGHGEDTATVAPRSRSLRTANLVLRLLTIALCIPVLVLMVRSSQTLRFIRLKARWQDVKAFIALVILTAILLAYSLLQALLGLVLGASHGFSWLTFICDQLLTYAMLGAAAASAEVAYIARRGAPKANWGKVCGVFDKFCNKAGASIILAFLAVALLVLTSAISAHNLFRHRSAAPAAR